jgi:hypothetical protein
LTGYNKGSDSSAIVTGDSLNAALGKIENQIDSKQGTLSVGYGDSTNPYENKAKNIVLAGPSTGTDAAPTFRALVADDIPSLAANKITALTGYNKGSDSSAIVTGDSLNAALGKIENQIDSKQTNIDNSNKLSADYIEGTVANATTASELGSSQTSFDSSNVKFVWAKDNNDKQGWYDVSTVVGFGADLAEIYRSKENLQPGDVVSIDTTRDDAIIKTKVAEDTLVAGVISTDPGLLLNSAEKGYKLALVGKVPTKVCNEGGEIKRGDLLVSASIAGYAKKAGDNPKAGTVIGKALENFSSKRGTILVLVNLQ